MGAEARLEEPPLRQVRPDEDVPQWWNGRRAGFKILFRKECPFESGLGHHLIFSDSLKPVGPQCDAVSLTIRI